MFFQSRSQPFRGRRRSATAVLAGIAAFLAVAAGILLSGLAAPPAEANSDGPRIGMLATRGLPPNGHTFLKGQDITVQIGFSKKIKVTGKPQIP